MARYNGHKNYNAWNVALWLLNDEPTYKMVMAFVRQCGTKDQAARRILITLQDDFGVDETPDGVRYTVTNIRAALVGLS